MLTDEELIARTLVDGDRQAFGVLVQRYQGPLRQFLRRLCADAARADDLAQETFMKAFSSLAGYSGKGRFISWLYRIGHREFLQHIRRTGRRTEIYQDVKADPQDGFGGTGNTADPNMSLDLQAALSQLGESERTVIILCTGQGLSHAEASDVLGMPLGTVKSHSTRGLEKLRRIMMDSEPRSA